MNNENDNPVTAHVEKACGWRCGDNSPEHKHYTVLVYEKNNGKYIGRLGSDGMAVKLSIHSLVLSKARAHEIAEEINNDGDLSATARLF